MNSFINKKKQLLFHIFIFILTIAILILFLNLNLQKTRFQSILKDNNLKNTNINLELEKIKMLILKNNKNIKSIKFLQNKLINEANMPHLNETIKKRTFEERLPLPKEIKCKPHLNSEELFYYN